MNYYNEFEPKAAAWLRELIKEGHIPKGHVDERSITEVNPGDLTGFTQCHFFAGIGGWPLALSLAGWPEDRPVWTGSCPCQPFSQAGKGLGEADPRHLWPVWFNDLISKRRPATLFGEQVASAAGRQWLAGVRADLEAVGRRFGAADLCAASVQSPHMRQRLFWLADTQDANGRRGECGEETETGPDGQRRGRFAGSSATSRMDDTTSDGATCRDASEPGSHRSNHGLSGAAGATSRMVHLQQQGLEGHSGNGDNGDKSGWVGAQSDGPATEASHSGGWTDSRWINCRDGKLRRVPVEPEFFPLAHGVPGRVGLLRGYGNAIVPQLAAEFIQAYLEAENDTAGLAFLE